MMTSADEMMMYSEGWNRESQTEKQTRIVSDKERDIYLAGAIEAERTYKKQLAEARAEVERLKRQAHEQAMKMGARIQLTETANRELVEAFIDCLSYIDTDSLTMQTNYREWKKAQNTPHAKLAAAQVEVLRAACKWKKIWSERPNIKDTDSAVMEEDVYLWEAVEALEAVEKGI